ncbi:(2Fe-2S)-binding protein [Bacillus sp. MRMR6]|uniref:(2Fe-2S)-binding protein n=1 Tax=Bacillus sp. MRMR6 TaxID=1928617 RepID=UPI0009513D39|nr:(2Fe-2S)-binding protein [Bacillus sp. MRMR6]OLS40541.1 xanthine dehydrogenase subunit E [Bacillus sp. MRMR6]
MDVKKSKAIIQPSPQIELAMEINSVKVKVITSPTARLVDLLRENIGLTGPKISCEIGRCGACAVHIDNKLINSCLVMAYQANHSSIRTVEGVEAADSQLIQKAFLEEGGFQCGYCTPGMVMAVKALLDSNPNPTPEQIQEGLSGNLCRCTGYGGIIRAVQSAIENLKASVDRSHHALNEVKGGPA